MSRKESEMKNVRDMLKKLINFLTQEAGVLMQNWLVLAIIVIAILFFPKTVRYHLDFTLGTLEEQVSILESLERLDQSEFIEQNKDLRFARDEIKKDFIEHLSGKHSIKSNLSRVSNYKPHLKFLLVVAPYIFFLFLVLKTESDRKAFRVVNLSFLSGMFVGIYLFFRNFAGEAWVVPIALLTCSFLICVVLYRKWIK